MTIPEELAKFQEDIAELPGLWRSIDLRVAAVRVNGGWHSIGARAYLDPRSMRAVPQFPSLRSTNGILVTQQVFDSERLGDILNGVAEGALRVGDSDIQFSAGRPSHDVTEPYRFRSGFSDLAGPWARDYVHWSALYAAGHGPTIEDLIRTSSYSRERIDATLRLGDAPYDGIDDLERYFLGKPQPSGTNTMVGFEIFAPIQVRIDRDRTRLEMGKLHVFLSAASREFLERCSLGFFGLGRGELPNHASFTPNLTSESQDPGRWGAELTGDVGDSSFGKLMLRVGPWCVDRVTVHDLHRPGRNQRQLAYQVLDRGQEILTTSLLKVTPDRSEQFERAVARLFFFLGYQVDSYAGDKRLGEGVDLLAHEPFRPIVLAIECTTGPPDSGGKLGRLVTRARTLAAELADVEVLPTLVTSLPNAGVPPAERDAVATNGVVLVTHDGIEELLGTLDQSNPPQVITSLLRAMIPAREVDWRGRTL